MKDSELYKLKLQIDVLKENLEKAKAEAEKEGKRQLVLGVLIGATAVVDLVGLMVLAAEVF